MDFKATVMKLTDKQQEALAWLRRENQPRTTETPRQHKRDLIHRMNRLGAASGQAVEIYRGQEYVENMSPNHNKEVL